MIIDNQVVEVDSEIRDQIRLLNELGYKTFTSCAGHEWEPQVYPYISFCDYNIRVDIAAPFCGLDFKDTRHFNRGYGMSIYAKREGDTEGFVRGLNELLKILLVIKMLEDKLEDVE